MLESTGRHLLLVIRRALRQPFSVVALALGVLSSLVSQSIVPLIIGIAAIAVFAGVKLRDESFIRAALREDQEGRRRDARRDRIFRIEELDVESRVRMKAITKLQREIEEDVINSPVDEVAVGLAETVEETEHIVDRGLAMAQKRTELLRYLSKTDIHSIEGRIRSLEARLAQETDEHRQAEIKEQLESKTRELQDYRAVETAASRVLEQLDGIEVAFSGLRARLVRIKSTDIADWVQANTELKTELAGLDAAVGHVEQSVEELLSVQASGQEPQ